MRKFLLKRLQAIRVGQLTLREAKQTWHFGDTTQHDYLDAIELHVVNKKFYSAVAFGGAVAAAESYVAGDWYCNDLTKLLRLFLHNQSTLDRFERGAATLLTSIRWLWHQLKRNTLLGSRKNIAAHYDLSNDFFKLFLDENWMYSSAIFPTPQTSLEEASRYKLDRICQKLELKPGDKVLEIGSGWGGFALHAAKYYGCDIVTTTISQQQYVLAAQRIAAENLGHKITLLQRDYRELEGQYDKLVSIEMIEAVGYQYYKTFFAACARLLKPNGKMLLQVITIQDQVYERAKREVDFIKRYIFPGSCIPSVTALVNAMTEASDMKLFDLEDIGLHYATTLRCWREKFLVNQAQIKKLGFDEKFIRLWLFYFCYCEAGFAEGYLGDVHMLCVKPRAIKE